MTNDLERALQRVLQETPDVDGMFLSTPDGLLIAAVVHDSVEPDVVAAMASAAAGLATQMATLLGLGPSPTTFVHGPHGGIGIRRVLGSAVLVVQGSPGRGVGSLQLSTGRLASRVEHILGTDSRG